jgi:hypothetical protein
MLRIGKVTKISLIVTTLLLGFLVSPVSAQSWTQTKTGCEIQPGAFGNSNLERMSIGDTNTNQQGNYLYKCCVGNIVNGPQGSTLIRNMDCPTAQAQAGVSLVAPGPAVVNPLALKPQSITNSPYTVCIQEAGLPSLAVPEKDANGNLTGAIDDSKNVAAHSTNLSNSIYAACFNCIKDNASPYGNIWTGIGCIKGTEEGIANTLMRIIYGVGLVFILIRIIIAGYLIQFGSNPDQIKENKQAIINALIALVVGTGGVVIARYIGYDILGLGNFLPGLPKVI